MEWLKEENLDEVRDIPKFQKLERFLKMSVNIYPDLVKVFLTNMLYDDETKQREWIWLLRNDDAIVSRRNTFDLGNFNNVQFYKSCLRNQDTVSRTFFVKGLATTPRILTYIVIWLLSPRGFNHVVLIEEDL